MFEISRLHAGAKVGNRCTLYCYTYLVDA